MANRRSVHSTQPMTLREAVPLAQPRSALAAVALAAALTAVATAGLAGLPTASYAKEASGNGDAPTPSSRLSGLPGSSRRCNS